MTVVALSGGVGGAKLALGLSRVLPAEELLVVVNTGDDFEHLGLSHLARYRHGDVHAGRARQSANSAGAAATRPGRSWRRWRRWAARPGSASATAISRCTSSARAGCAPARRCPRSPRICAARLGVGPRVLPMSDDPVRTRVRTDEGWIDFQEYFVRRRCEPVVHELAFHGAATARAQPEFLAALADPRLQAVVICPSNPFISIEPILAVPGVRAALADCAAPVIAVSPIIGGRAVKGPTAKMMAELGMTPSAGARGASLRRSDRWLRLSISPTWTRWPAIDARVTLAQTLMTTLDDREALARTVLGAARRAAARR